MTVTETRAEAPTKPAGMLGQVVRWVEDAALLRREGWFIDDMDPLLNTYHAAIVRSSVALDESGKVADARLALGAVADRPVPVPMAGDALGGSWGDESAVRAAAAEAQVAVDPGQSLHAPSGYWRHLIGMLATRALRQAVAKANERLAKGGSR